MTAPRKTDDDLGRHIFYILYNEIFYIIGETFASGGRIVNFLENVKNQEEESQFPPVRNDFPKS